METTPPARGTHPSPEPSPVPRVLAVRAVGTTAVLAELSGLPGVLALQALLLEQPLPGQVDIVAAARTVLVIADSPRSARRMPGLLLALELAVQHRAGGRLVTIDTLYDGEDLAEVGRLTGLGPDGVVSVHAGQVWTVAFGGFAPGFGYMVGENHLLDVPRRTSPRIAVPAGSVALAGGYSAVYPRESPGGWQLIGRTAARMWDLGREQPALAAPGDRVRFRPVRELVEVTSPAAGLPAAGLRPAGSSEQVPAAPAAEREGRAPEAASGLRILSPGLLSLLQDLGRPGHAGLGVGASGALDRAAARRGNRLVGNKARAAVVEIAAGGLKVQALGDHVLAVTGAPAELRIDPPADKPRQDPYLQRHVVAGMPFALLAGEVLTIGPPQRGFRTYLALRGGVEAEVVLGSRSTDTLSGLGPAPLAAGDVIPAGYATFSQVVGDPELQPELPGQGVTVLDVVPGPREEWFDARAVESLYGQEWEVTPRSNRVGMRLSGKPLQRSREGELPSEGMVAGALQVPPEGQPVLFLADHPVSGGYPVIAVVADHQLDLAGQIPIGARIRFRRVAD